MWRNPKFHPGDTATAERSGPPQPDGTVLAEFPRRPREGPDQLMRVVLQEYQGHPYIAVSLWERGRGGFWPVKGKAMSIRRAEAADFANAIFEALERMEDAENRAEAEAARTATPAPAGASRGKGNGRRYDPASVQGASRVRPGGDFDEFEGGPGR